MNPLEIIVGVDGKFQEYIMNQLAPKARPVDYVYHYASMASFLSIMSTNQLWLSHASFMNDPTEIDFGIRAVLSMLDQYPGTDRVRRVIEQQMDWHNQYALDVNRDLAFVLSFTESEDHIAPWMQYADGGNGVSLQFIQQFILKKLSTIVPSKCMYFPVQYFYNTFKPCNSNIEDFIPIVRKYYTDMEELIKSNDIEKDIQLQSALYSATKLLGSFIKSAFHEAEHEWRFVLFTGRGDRRIKIKQHGKSLRMIYEIDFDKEKVIKLIDNIWVGPKHRDDHRIVAAAEIAVRQHQGKDMNIQFSQGLIRKEET